MTGADLRSSRYNQGAGRAVPALHDRDGMEEDAMLEEIAESELEGRGVVPEESRTPPATDPPPAWRRPAAPAPVAAEGPRLSADQVSAHYAGHVAETTASAF